LFDGLYDFYHGIGKNKPATSFHTFQTYI